MAIEMSGIGSSGLTETGENSASRKIVNEGQEQVSRNTNPTQNLSDQVTITPSAAKLHAVEQKLASVPVVDQQRVDQLRSAIESGQYQIDAKRTAEKFLQFETILHR
jgi:negative regulator of flagellin synthesis FlgM